MRAGKRQLHDLLEGHPPVGHDPRPRIDDDLDLGRRPGRRGEALDAGRRQVDQLTGLDQPILAASNLQEHGLVIARLSQGVEDGAADGRLAPRDLAVVERQLEVTIGLEGDEALGPALAEVERLVEPDILEVARGQDGEEAVAVSRVPPAQVPAAPSGSSGEACRGMTDRGRCSAGSARPGRHRGGHGLARGHLGGLGRRGSAGSASIENFKEMK